ncbi:pentatricopeptide repeat-containing protein At2g35030, mitochondrial-like [Selaginella moellendorffii]|uniref:pentatricopeptide repeat-containing protein At2g35030, mitochondrial-like n=1 Tax=Selaginella moellendorffii TaxID=88036 RepID=UPI000D1C407A|nr:pentatricopeptide repeat-containing protein At2g35030, mitochondrial-like [Selaginella moellendorffii]|eukprot:XP_024539388.1 pentatricopeptide repeat-containing protein At2g35030, mitochondrial-like [Selaginella moellendorffii]
MPEYDLVSWNSILAAYARNGHVEGVERVFDSMEARDLVSWTTILVALSQGGDLHGAKLLFDAMPQHDLVAWTAMLGAYALNEDVDSAQRIFREMPEIDLVSCNTVMRCCRDARQSKLIFDSMPQRALSSWTTMLAVLAKNSPGEETKSFFYQMLELDLTSCMIMFLSQPSDLELVKATFDQIPQRDLCSWNSVLSAYAQ